MLTRTLGHLSDQIRRVILSSGRVENIIPVVGNYRGTDWLQHAVTALHPHRTVANKDSSHEIVVITWPPGWSGDFHDHSERGCVFRCMKGIMGQTIIRGKGDGYDSALFSMGKDKYDLEKYMKVHGHMTIEEKIFKDEVKYIDNDVGLHAITTPLETGAVSLHVYSPPDYQPKWYTVQLPRWLQ